MLKQRIEENQDHRLKSGIKYPNGDAFKYRDTPHLFRPNKNRPKDDYLCIPAHVTETRKYFTASVFNPKTISGNANFQVADPDGLQFGLISSSMFITWQRTVGGRMKSDLRFANTLTWNTFPVPELSDQDQAAIINGGKAVLEARAKFPNRSLADHYQPLAMDPDLLKAHDKLDKAVDKAFGAPRKLTNEKQRQELLFQNYVRLTQE